MLQAVRYVPILLPSSEGAVVGKLRTVSGSKETAGAGGILRGRVVGVLHQVGLKVQRLCRRHSGKHMSLVLLEVQVRQEFLIAVLSNRNGRLD